MGPPGLEHHQEELAHEVRQWQGPWLQASKWVEAAPVCTVVESTVVHWLVCAGGGGGLSDGCLAPAPAGLTHFIGSTHSRLLLFWLIFQMTTCVRVPDAREWRVQPRLVLT